MATFLMITCIKPVQKFFGIISLRISLIIMAIIIAACGTYTYFESEVFFKDQKLFGVINNIIFTAIEGAIALLVFIGFFVQKKCYSFIIYLLTLGIAGLTLAYNIVKVSLINDKMTKYKVEHKLIQIMFIIRITAELFIQMVASYYCFSYEQSL